MQAVPRFPRGAWESHGARPCPGRPAGNSDIRGCLGFGTVHGSFGLGVHGVVELEDGI